ncbi:TPA: hypothetical protein ACJKHM_000275 [Neisseria meningitidis]|nr:hypothetical protein [Neisseria benedictiae]
MKAGGDINIRSREGDITVQGSNIDKPANRLN